jgi:hypothetical protein
MSNAMLIFRVLSPAYQTPDSLAYENNTASLPYLYSAPGGRPAVVAEILFQPQPQLDWAIIGRLVLELSKATRLREVAVSEYKIFHTSRNRFFSGKCCEQTETGTLRSIDSDGGALATSQFRRSAKSEEVATGRIGRDRLQSLSCQCVFAGRFSAQHGLLSEHDVEHEKLRRNQSIGCHRGGRWQDD